MPPRIQTAVTLVLNQVTCIDNLERQELNSLYMYLPLVVQHQIEVLAPILALSLVSARRPRSSSAQPPNSLASIEPSSAGKFVTRAVYTAVDFEAGCRHRGP
ncbi:hypothetical protein B0H11DRAFT_2182794 [Mycena galericulata]|nr:hypothetical protein B0H11DRAFT_2182794 [Mycena galericulata]